MSTSDSYYVDLEAARKAVDFFPRFLRHCKGQWAGRPFELARWQAEITAELFGVKRKADGQRRYRTAYIEVPRKNGKSTWAAGLALYLLFADGEQGAEVYSCAAERGQAAVVFDVAKQMIATSRELSKRSVVYKYSVAVHSSASAYRALSAEAYSKHGLNAHGVIFDEVHAQPNRELWDVMNTSTGARQQPLTIALTTAGHDRTSLCWELHEYAERVSSGEVEDPTFFGYIAGASPDDDWTDPKVWAMANPSYGVTVSEEFLEMECRKAREVPAFQNTFRRLYLNQWTSQDTRFLDMDVWSRCATPVGELRGRVCYAGLDLASTTDIAALVLVFPPVSEDEPYKVLPFFWVPEEGIYQRGQRDRVPYEAWASAGHLYATDGAVIDYRHIRATIDRLADQYRIAEVAFDRWGAVQMSQELDEAGYTMVPFGQGFASMAAPTKELLAKVVSGTIAHGGHPVLDWMANNLRVKTDPAGNVKPDKGKSRERIDGMVALVMALDRAVRREHSPVVSIYETEELMVL